jgi:hypothetical protein
MIRLETSAENHLLAGASLTEAWDAFRDTALTRCRLIEIRDTIFRKLAHPDHLKALADGPLLNANAVVRYRHARPRIKRPKIEQLSILDIVDGHMGRTA